tara:strand:- start:7035 stop:7685 length:651 start_codon:yes stop_codon:yes gene_type:complete
MKQEELKEILSSHSQWLSGKDGELANLRWANLSRANLSGADLRWADLRWADLRWADLSGANLSEANLSRVNLSEANLSEANLSRANLSEANLSGADLSEAILPHFQIPQGELIVYKNLYDAVIATLKIDSHTPRTGTLVGRKCRAASAFVLALSHGKREAFSWRDLNFKYAVGELVYPDSYDDDIRIECTNGIHFYLTRKEAECSLHTLSPTTCPF